MTQEEKSLLLKDLCARLPYYVMVDYESHIYILNEIDPACKDIDYITVRIQDVERSMCAINVMIENIKPYLRPMDSMTIDESKEYRSLLTIYNCGGETTYWNNYKSIDWLNKHHFDFRHLIPMSLALKALEGMYKQS